MTPAERAALALKAISAVKPGAEPAADHARALAQPGHVLDLGVWPGDTGAAGPEASGAADAPTRTAPDSCTPAATPIAVDSPGAFSDLILQALFGAWPPVDESAGDGQASAVPPPPPSPRGGP